MDIDDFFDKHKPLIKVKIQGGQVDGIMKTTCDSIPEYTDDVVDYDSAFNYAQEYKDKEAALCTENANKIANLESDLTRPDTPTSIAVASAEHEIDLEVAGTVFQRYCFNHRQKESNLSIDSYHEQIIETVAANPTVIIQGPTGCGKSTQVAQFILDYCNSKNKYCKIAVTQPRRIAAISVAKRVAEERGWVLGSVVGYQVGLEAKISEDTILTYMTTGILLQKLIQQKTLNQFTHIIIDEVHEREAEMDFLLLVVRRFARTVSPHVKVILMSATFDVNHFATYFALPQRNKLVAAPVIDIMKAQPYIVNIFYLNQFSSLLPEGYLPEFVESEPTLHKNLQMAVVQLLRAFNRIESNSPTNIGSVLIFLPGIYEIETLYEELKEHNQEPIRWYVVPLHSSITVEEQRRAFDKPPENHRKIILSTNIAESSITVPDVVYVIDFCLTKVLMSDNQSNYTSLKLVWASHTNCQQRSGRVGRVASGRVYRMVPETFYNKSMATTLVPDMLRSPLHRLVLLSKMLELNIPPKAILALAIDHPPLHHIEKTVMLLKEAGALLPTSDGVYEEGDGDLTYLGRIMAQLPVDIDVSKMIVLGHMFSTLKECIIMGAAMSLQNIFSSPFKERMKAYMSKLYWADCSSSDLIAYLHVYIVWERNKYNNLYRVSDAEMNWMRRNFLQPRIMREWRILVNELKQRLNQLGITEPVDGRAVNLSEHEKAMMLKVVISGAFYPNYFVRSSEGGQVDESMAVRILGGRDPYTTVYFSGKPQNQPIQLYAQSVKKLLEDCGQNMIVSYDSSSKVFVQFKHDVMPNNQRANGEIMPGKIPVEVYNAVKRRHLKLSNEIRCLSAEESNYRVKQWQKLQTELKPISSDEDVPFKSIMPNLDALFITLRVSYVNDPGHFFVYNLETPNILGVLDKIAKDLNTKPLENVRGQIVVGHTYAAPFNGKYYRARVVCMQPQRNSDYQVQIIFIDYGNTECVRKEELKHLLPIMYRIPPLALECVLTGIQPSHEMDAHALWSKKAIEDFIIKTEGVRLYGKIYSVVDGIVSLELYQQESGLSKSLNTWMMEKDYAQPANESFLSQDDHKRREYFQNTNSLSGAECEPNTWFTEVQQEMPAPTSSECHFTMTLKGPYSALEMQMYSILQCSLNQTVNIEISSVNSVLLDTDPQDPHDRLLVAGSINVNPNNARLTLRNTTMMPKIHGFPVLMALIFCPTMELHTNAEGSRLTSILFGVGFDPQTKKALFSAHDLALNLDFELTDDDITKVNEVRYFMNQALSVLSCFKTDAQPVMAIETCQNEIRSCIRHLLKVPRRSMDREILPHTYVWGKLPSHVEVLSSYYSDTNDTWPMHSSVKLKDNSKIELQKHLVELDDVASSTVVVNEITCKLCSIVLYDSVSTRLHLLSRIHTENLKTFQ